MKQVIIFGQRSHVDLQKEINNWIAANHSTHEILDIKFSTISTNIGTSYCRAMIIYEKKTSN
jgi:hypothetical protein